jgi:hypothetical protein
MPFVFAHHKHLNKSDMAQLSQTLLRNMLSHLTKIIILDWRNNEKKSISVR